MIVHVATALALLIMSGAPGTAQFSPADLYAVGAFDRGAAEPTPDPSTLREMRQAHFTVVPASSSDPSHLLLIDRLLARAPDAVWHAPAPGARVVPAAGAPSGNVLTARAWRAFAEGSAAVIFDDWQVLRAAEDLLSAAAGFAAEVTRNARLYAPLRPAPARSVRVQGSSDGLWTTFLESADALVFIAINDAQARRVTFLFPADVPEAIWQNMLGGGAVNFVAGQTGPTYTRELTAHEVLLLMIRKRWR